MCLCLFFFFFNDTATTEIYTLSLHDALPIYHVGGVGFARGDHHHQRGHAQDPADGVPGPLRHQQRTHDREQDRKSTRLNSSHANISYAVFCLKKKKKKPNTTYATTNL